MVCCNPFANNYHKVKRGSSLPPHLQIQPSLLLANLIFLHHPHTPNPRSITHSPTRQRKCKLGSKGDHSVVRPVFLKVKCAIRGNLGMLEATRCMNTLCCQTGDHVCFRFVPLCVARRNKKSLPQPKTLAFCFRSNV